MYYEKESNTLSFVAGLAIGAILGAGIAYVSASHLSKGSQKQIARTTASSRRSARGGWDDLAAEVRRAVRGGRRRRA